MEAFIRLEVAPEPICSGAGCNWPRRGCCELTRIGGLRFAVAFRFSPLCLFPAPHDSRLYGTTAWLPGLLSRTAASDEGRAVEHGRPQPHLRHVARGRPPLRLSRIRRSPAGAAGALHQQVGRGNRRPALQLPRQGRARRGHASRDDADPCAHGRRARARLQEALQVVLHSAALPLREAAEGPQARTLPAQLRHPRRDRPRRRRGTHRAAHRHAARARVDQRGLRRAPQQPRRVGRLLRQPLP